MFHLRQVETVLITDVGFKDRKMLTVSEGESLNCIPDDNSVCVDGEYGVVQPKYYFSQH